MKAGFTPVPLHHKGESCETPCISRPSHRTMGVAGATGGTPRGPCAGGRRRRLFSASRERPRSPAATP
jgi:hypothetical protein